MGRFHLTQRQWRIYLVSWLVAVAAITGALAGIFLPRLLAPAPTPILGGGLVMGAREVAAPDFTLRDQTGATVSMRQLRGKVLALTFLDTQCQNICPLQASFLGSAQSDLGRRAPFEVVVVSVHPDVDTPANIDAFAVAHGLGHNYYWLNGPLPDLQSVWDRYGVAVQAAQGDLAHSSVIFLIDRNGYERVGFEDVPETGAFETDVQILNAS
jgi:cytochrome oxidase Cu insertion factor (SCO1/SenC/PrrC family)